MQHLWCLEQRLGHCKDESMNRNRDHNTDGSCQHESCGSEEFVKILNKENEVFLVLRTTSSFARVFPIKICSNEFYNSSMRLLCY